MAWSSLLVGRLGHFLDRLAGEPLAVDEDAAVFALEQDAVVELRLAVLAIRSCRGSVIVEPSA